MVDSPSPVPSPPREAIKSPISVVKDALAKSHQIVPTPDPAPTTVDLPESDFEQQAPDAALPLIEGEAPGEAKASESPDLDEAEGRVNATANGTHSNNDSPTGDDPIQSDAVSPNVPASPAQPTPADDIPDALDQDPAAPTSDKSPTTDLQPSDHASPSSGTPTAPPTPAEAPPVQGLIQTENLEGPAAVTTHTAKSDPADPHIDVLQGSRESAVSGSSADINLAPAAAVLQEEAPAIVPEHDPQADPGPQETSATTDAADAQLEDQQQQEQEQQQERTSPPNPLADSASATTPKEEKIPTADEDVEMDTTFSHHVVDSLQPSQFFSGSDLSMIPDDDGSTALLPHQSGLEFADDNVEVDGFSSSAGPVDPSTGDDAVPDFMQPANTTSNDDLSLSVADFINDSPDDPPQMDLDASTSTIPFPSASSSTDPVSSSSPNVSSSTHPTQPLPNGTTPQPSTTSPVQNTLQPSPSWAPTNVSDGDATNGSATAAESTSSPTTSQAPNPPATAPEVKPPIQAEIASKIPTEQPSNGVSREASHGVSPNAASTAVNSDAGDHKPPSPALSKTGSAAGALVKGDPKAGLVLSLNEELIKICVAFSSIAPSAAEANEYQARLSSNLGWLASVADTATQHLKPGSAVALPILQPPKPLPPSALTSQCADSLQKLPGLYARMQEAFKVDVERKLRRDAKLRARATSSGSVGFGSTPGMGTGTTGLPPPGAAMPVAGVKREHEVDAETGDRKRAAVGAGVPMSASSAGGSPTRPPTVRAASLALSSTQSPVLAPGQNPLVGGMPGAGVGGVGMGGGVGMSTPRIPASGFVAPLSMPHRHSPQNSISGAVFGQGAQVSPVGGGISQQQQQQRQPSLPPTAQHSPTHPQMPNSNQFGHQQPQLLAAQTTGDAGGFAGGPQRPPSVSQAIAPGFSQASQPSFQAPGIANRGQQQPGMGMSMVPGRAPMTDDQRVQQQQHQLQMQHMRQQQMIAQQQGLTPMQLQQQQQAQAFGQIQASQQAQGVQGANSMQPNALKAGGGGVGPGMGGPASGGVAGTSMPNTQMNPAMVQTIMQSLQNMGNPITQHLLRSIPNFASLPLQMQVTQFHAVQTRVMQNQQQQREQAMAANAANGNVNVNGAQAMQQRPPSAAGPGSAIPPGISGLRNMRQGTASPRMPSTVPPQGMATPQRQISGQHGGMNPPTSTGGMGAQGMTPQQRQTMLMMQQQQNQLNRMQPPGGVGAGGGQSPSPSHHQFGQGLPNMSPMNRQAAAQFGNQAGQVVPGGGAGGAGGNSGPWSAGTPAGYVSSPLNPGWSPQAGGGGPGGMSAASPAGSGFHVGASPAHHSEAGATPRHSGATPQGGMGMGGSGFGEPAGTDFGNAGIDPSALFNEWPTQ